MATIETLIKKLDDDANKNFANYPELKWVHKATKGKKYIKIIAERAIGGAGGAVHCFIDDEGNIYKPAGWAKPAKGVRANLETLDINKVDSCGGWLYARG